MNKDSIEDAEGNATNSEEADELRWKFETKPTDIVVLHFDLNPILSDGKVNKIDQRKINQK